MNKIRIPDHKVNPFGYLLASGLCATKNPDNLGRTLDLLFRDGELTVFSAGSRCVVLDSFSKELLTAIWDKRNGLFHLRATYTASGAVEVLATNRSLNPQVDLAIFLYDGGHFYGRVLPQNIIAPGYPDPTTSPNYLERQLLLNDVVAKRIRGAN